MQMDTHIHTHTQHNHLLALLITLCCLRCRLWCFSFIKVVKNSGNMNCCVHHFIPSAFICGSGLFFIQPLQVKLCKVYLTIKQRTSLTSVLASFFTDAPLLASFFPSLALSLPLRVSFCPTGPLSGAIEPQLVYIYPLRRLPDGSVAPRVPSFPLRYSPGVSVFSTFDPRPWQQEQECQEWLAG